MPRRRRRTLRRPNPNLSPTRQKRNSLRKKRRTSLAVAAVCAAVLLLSIASLIFCANRKLSHLVLGGRGESFSTRIYGAPYVIAPGVRVSLARLMYRLNRLGYRKVAGPPAMGQYSWDPPILSVHLRGFQFPQPGQEAALVHLVAQAENQWTPQSPSVFSSVSLEPELIGELSGTLKLRREPASWDEIPADLKDAIVAIEDRRFYRHPGLDIRAIFRAAWHNIVSAGGMQGGSTITQQLAKNLLLNPRRTFRRKTAEAVLALYLERRYSKREILTLYLNHIYLGQDGIVSIAGVKSAAQHFFAKKLRDLTRAECALLAGIIRRPADYNPLQNPDAALARRNLVLRRMRNENMISEEELAAAQAEPLVTRPVMETGAAGRDQNAYAVAEVVRQMVPRYTEEELYRYGLGIHTTIDPVFQSAAHNALAPTRRQAALVAIDPPTGRILALSGGKNFRDSQFNRATQALRQPGSAFKPFVYGAALEKGFTPASTLQDTPESYFGVPGGRWTPKNFDRVYHGTVSLRVALAQSLNSATVDLARRVGPLRIVEFARRMGIESPLDNSLALALGSSEVSPLELTAAYAPFANGGFHVRPWLITAVYDADGNPLESFGIARHLVIDPALAALMTSLLESVVREGTARGLSEMGWTRPAAGKTGTTNFGRDAWFVGYTPQHLAGVWAGDDKNAADHGRSSAERDRDVKRSAADHMSGSRDALPIWAAFMKETLEDVPPAAFAEPQGLIQAMIDPLSGLRAVAGCPEKRKESFLAGTEPDRFCHLHRGGLSGWLERLFGGK